LQTSERYRAPVSDRYRAYVLAALTCSYVFNYLDRYVLTILVEPIKAELGVSDAWMGFLIGPAFAVFYTGLGVPVARLADRSVRVHIVAAGFALWSAFTVLSGFARGALELTLARIGVGVGEAAGAAPCHSLLSDYFPPERRARALGVFQLGVYLGQFLGLAAGGLLVAPLGWRWTFVAVGAPGLVLALALAVTVREPPRGGVDATPRAPAAASAAAVWRTLWALRSFRWLAVGAGLASFAGTGFGFWVPTLFVRVHGLSFAEVGASFGVISPASAALGSLLAGALADRLGGRSANALLGVPAASVALSLPFLCAICLWPSAWGALALAVPSGILGGGWAPPTYAAVQNLVPAQMRAVAASILILFITLFGMGAGPWAVGWLSDLLAPRFGAGSLRYALVAVLSVSAFGAAALARGAQLLPADLAAARGRAER
jgi:MFS family permease